jgi:two-component system chemotaxis sensor kinase CheA
VAREASEQESRDLINLTTRLLKDRVGFSEFFEETGRLLERLTQNQGDAVTLKRDLHTLKGNTALYGLTRLSAVCHRLESELDERRPEALERSGLASCWQQYATTIGRMLGQRDTTLIEVEESRYDALLDALLHDAPKPDLVRALRTWRLESLRVRLERVAEQLVSTAAQLGKGTVAVHVQTEDVYLGHDELREFWAAFSHVIRNAAVHGLALGATGAKGRKGAEFDLLAGIEQNRLFVELADSGPGIDWEGIRRRARTRGIPHTTQAELEEALFIDGISTSVDLDELAGRGVGLSAVRAACLRRHGSVRIKTARGAGTSFRFSWPTSQFRSLVQLESGGAA